MTRIQGERFADKNEYLRLRDSYVLDVEKLEKAKPDLAILHPLPRVNEISVKVDDDPRACYFKQVANGKYMRAALILKCLDDAEKGKKTEKIYPSGSLINVIKCQNTRCITTTEQELDQVFTPTDKAGIYKCHYCESKAEHHG
jgi:aspartate carbamoyltransferase catalytic subunit